MPACLPDWTVQERGAAATLYCLSRDRGILHVASVQTCMSPPPSPLPPPPEKGKEGPFLFAFSSSPCILFPASVSPPVQSMWWWTQHLLLRRVCTLATESVGCAKLQWVPTWANRSKKASFRRSSKITHVRRESQVRMPRPQRQPTHAPTPPTHQPTHSPCPRAQGPRGWAAGPGAWVAGEGPSLASSTRSLRSWIRRS